MTPVLALIMIAAAFIVGIAAGSAAAHSCWMTNAHEPKRVQRNGKFYKVVKISDSWSWRMADIHRGDSDVVSRFEQGGFFAVGPEAVEVLERIKDHSDRRRRWQEEGKQ